MAGAVCSSAYTDVQDPFHLAGCLSRLKPFDHRVAAPRTDGPRPRLRLRAVGQRLKDQARAGLRPNALRC